MPDFDLLRAIAPPLLAFATAVGVDRLTDRKGLLPPAFRSQATEFGSGATLPVRRILALVVIWGVLWIGVFAPLGVIGMDVAGELGDIAIPQLFSLHILFGAALLSWYLLGFSGADRRRSDGVPGWMVQFGFRAGRIWGEIGLGMVAGVGAWLFVIAVLLVIGILIWSLGGEQLLPKEPPALIPWIATLPIGLRLALSLSAGAVEETFFRGFLQPRVGIIFSTLLFVLAHASYAQPLMLVGITLLSVVYALLVRWRQNIWPAIAAHTLFDAVQLVVVIPAALEFMPRDAEQTVTPLALVAENLLHGVGSAYVLIC